MKNTLKNVGKVGAVAGTFAIPIVGIPASIYLAKKFYGKQKPKKFGKFKEFGTHQRIPSKSDIDTEFRRTV